MFKLIIYLLIVTQICCLTEEDNKTFKEDEIDITTSKSIDSPKVDDKQTKDILKDGHQNPDINVKKESPNNFDEKLPDYDDSNINNEKPIANSPGLVPKVEEVDEKITKTVEKPLSSDRDFDLGKDYKKVVIKTNTNGKEEPFGSKPSLEETDKNFNGFGGGGGGGGDYGSDQDKGYQPQGSHHNRKNEVEIGNQVMDNLLKLIKTDYRSDFEQVKLNEHELFKHGRWGTVKLHSGVVTGLTNAERVGNVVIVDEIGNKKLIISDIVVKDVYADYKLNAKLFHRISFKDRELKLYLKKAVLNVKLEVDKSLKKLIVKELNLKTFEGFSVKSSRLFWPFNKLTNAIAKNQEHVIKGLIAKEFNKYMGRAVDSIQFDEVFAKL